MSADPANWQTVLIRLHPETAAARMAGQVGSVAGLRLRNGSRILKILTSETRTWASLHELQTTGESVGCCFRFRTYSDTAFGVTTMRGSASRLIGM